MNTLEVTDEQYAFIQQLRERISADVVGKYGYVRERDAIQFLIDNLDGDLEVEVDTDIEIDGEFDSAAGQDVAASVDAALSETEPSDGDAITFDESEDALGGGEGEIDEDEEEGESDGLEDDGDESADDEVDEVESGDEAETETDDETGTESADDGGAADDDDMLDQMMNLLDTHDDKWEESPSADYRYRVELPDGGTEDVQTKDDVRAILFKNYR